MSFLADENFPRPAVGSALRAVGIDVLWIAESNPGASDDAVLTLAVSTQRTLLTFDKDFGELAYRRKLPAQCGIVLFRVTPQSPDETASLAVAAIRSQKSWAGYFSVVTRHRIGMRRLPTAGPVRDLPIEP